MKNILNILLLLSGLTVLAQQSPTKTTIIIPKVSRIDPMAPASSFAPLLQNVEAPKPGGDSYHAFLNQQKIKSAKRYPKTQNKTESIILGETDNPIIMNEMGMRKYIAQIDLENIYNGGTPLDNTMALSSNYLLASVNSFLWAWDLKGDSNLFVDEHGSTYTVSFAEFGKDYITNPGVESPFDPKLLYIPQYDRFIFLFLSGRKPTDSKIIVGFSSTNDPRDPWNVYKLNGNPRGVDQWSDFPMMGFDKDHLFLSINLLKSNTSWQLGFQGSIVWQMPLDKGFSGDSNLTTQMYDNILYKGTNIRNLTPVQHTDHTISINDTNTSFTFLSNRNFDLQNDSIFFFDIHENRSVTSAITLPKPYGMPPNGIQADDNVNDTTDGLQTNDARFLGAIRYINSENNGFIEFVGNTKDFSTGRAAIYHGILANGNTQLADQANIIGVDSLDFGYPNIAYFSNGENCYEGSLIAFNHTSFTTPAGVSAIKHSNFEGYSEIIRLKEGDDYVRRIGGSYERWGDYFGIQTVPGHPNQIYTSGFYGTDKKSSSTWFNKLLLTDTVTLQATLTQETTSNFVSTVNLEAQGIGGFPPYRYLWSDSTQYPNNTVNILGEGIYSVSVTDTKGCTVSHQATGLGLAVLNHQLYPNPVVDNFSVSFDIVKDTEASFTIYDMLGKIVSELGNQRIIAGTNVFSFSARPLSKGRYILIIRDGSNNNIVQKSFVKL